MKLQKVVFALIGMMFCLRPNRRAAGENRLRTTVQTLVSTRPTPGKKCKRRPAPGRPHQGRGEQRSGGKRLDGSSFGSDVEAFAIETTQNQTNLGHVL